MDNNNYIDLLYIIIKIIINNNINLLYIVIIFNIYNIDLLCKIKNITIY